MSKLEGYCKLTISVSIASKEDSEPAPEPISQHEGVETRENPAYIAWCEKNDEQITKKIWPAIQAAINEAAGKISSDAALDLVIEDIELEDLG